MNTCARILHFSLALLIGGSLGFVVSSPCRAGERSSASVRGLAGQVLSREINPANQSWQLFNEGLLNPEDNAAWLDGKSFLHYEDTQGNPIDQHTFLEEIWDRPYFNP
jgi:hypothetical protein